MRLKKSGARRSGAALVEAAIVIPVILILLYGLICGALMVLAVDEVETATREAARYASVRGSSYAFNSGTSAATPESIAQYAKDHGVTLDRSKMTCNVTWDKTNRPGNYVTVEVRYQWPGLGPFPAREMVSRSTMLITY